MDTVLSVPAHAWERWSFDQSGRKGAPPRPIDILIGCPIQKRDWIIEKWFWHCITACKIADVKPGFIFVMDTKEEPLTTMIRNLTEINGLDTWIGPIQEEERPDKREWNSIRYDKMVALRNTLLEGVRQVAPPMFLSLDSDILLNRDALKSMIENLQDETRSEYPFAAIGGKAYMTTTGTSHPSYGMLLQDNMLRRQDLLTGVYKVDVIMAIKLMLPAAYNVDYVWASQGEDIGWSQNCRKQQLKLLWDGTYTNKHIMRPEELERIDVRAGY